MATHSRQYHAYSGHLVVSLASSLVVPNARALRCPMRTHGVPRVVLRMIWQSSVASPDCLYSGQCRASTSSLRPSPALIGWSSVIMDFPPSQASTIHPTLVFCPVHLTIPTTSIQLQTNCVAHPFFSGMRMLDVCLTSSPPHTLSPGFRVNMFLCSFLPCSSFTWRHVYCVKQLGGGFYLPLHLLFLCPGLPSLFKVLSVGPMSICNIVIYPETTCVPLLVLYEVPLAAC